MQNLGIVVFCQNNDKDNYLNLVGQINNLTLPTDLKKIIVFPMFVGEEESYTSEVIPDLKPHVFMKEIKDKNTKNAIEPRLYNCALSHILMEDLDFVVFFRSSDSLFYENLLVYYMWLFNNSHNKDFLGAVCCYSSVYNKKVIGSVNKMWYVDDIKVRGTCFRFESIKETGPFDEYLKHEFFEPDYATRIIFHTGKLIRAGKETVEMFSLSGTPVNKANKNTHYLRRSSGIWFAHKWTKKGLHPGNYSCIVSNEPTSKNSDDFLSLFECPEETLRLRSKRHISISSDEPTKKAISVSEAFNKKELLPGFPSNVSFCSDSSEISSYIDTQLSYNPVLWPANPIKE